MPQKLLLYSLFALFLSLPFSLPIAWAEDLSGYKSGSGIEFSFDLPQDWIVAESGGYGAGNMSINTSDACILLTWMRDPGIEPEKILDNVGKTYSGDEIKILSSERGQIWMESQEVKAKTLDLEYKLTDYRSRDLFAVWNSSRSDRLFFAYLSSYRDNYTRSSETFKQVLESFADLGGREVLMPEAVSGQSGLHVAGNAAGSAWTMVLSDLLASYSYKDAANLPPRNIHLQTRRSLHTFNGTYLISTEETLLIDQPELAAARAGAVQDLLSRNGYETRLIQDGGNIWIAVRNPSGWWQSVSINPKDPKRMVGVLVGDGCSGIVYENISDLAKDNLMSFRDSDRGSGIIVQKDCEPSRYVELKQPSVKNQSWIGGLQDILDSRDYRQIYRENVFDCSNTSQICWSILQGEGYDVRLMMSYKGHPLDPHMWIVVRYPYETERYVAVEATNTNKGKKLLHLGKIATDGDHYNGIMYNSSAQFSRLHPEEGMWLTQ